MTSSASEALACCLTQSQQQDVVHTHETEHGCEDDIEEVIGKIGKRTHTSLRSARCSRTGAGGVFLEGLVVQIATASELQELVQKSWPSN